MIDADFFLASDDMIGFEEPRRSKSVMRLHSDTRGELLLITIEPPLNGKRYGLDEDIHSIVVAPLLKGTSLFPIRKWPIHVYVLLPRAKNVEQRGHVDHSELEIIARAGLYRTEEDARRMREA